MSRGFQASYFVSVIAAPYFRDCLHDLFGRTRRRWRWAVAGERRASVGGASMPLRLMLRLNSLVRCWFCRSRLDLHQLGVLEVKAMIQGCALMVETLCV